MYSQNALIKKAVDALKEGVLAETEEEKNALRFITQLLLEPQPGNGADAFFVLKDLENYYDTQKRAEELFADPISWAKYSLHNIAAMGPFSTDETIHNYAKKTWGIDSCPVDTKCLKKVRDEYSEHDKCRIL